MFPGLFIKLKGGDYMKIMGIDPSISCSGWVLIEDGKLKKYGTIRTSTDDNKRFLYIFNEFDKLIKKLNPDEIHVETPYIGLNAQTGLNLAYVRGGLIILCERLNVPMVSLAPQEIKKAITGSGRATKEEVFNVLCDKFKGDKVFNKIGPFSDKNNEDKTSDIYDALASAITEKSKSKEKTKKKKEV